MSPRWPWREAELAPLRLDNALDRLERLTEQLRAEVARLRELRDAEQDRGPAGA